MISSSSALVTVSFIIAFAAQLSPEQAGAAAQLDGLEEAIRMYSKYLLKHNKEMAQVVKGVELFELLSNQNGCQHEQERVGSNKSGRC